MEVNRFVDLRGSRARPRSSSAWSCRGSARIRLSSSRARSNGWPSSAGVSCISGVSTKSFRMPRWLAAHFGEFLGEALVDFPVAARFAIPGCTASDSGWMNGCMSEVFRSSFSYQVAVGSTMSEYRQVVRHAEVQHHQQVQLALGAAGRTLIFAGLDASLSSPLHHRVLRCPAGISGSTRGPCPSSPGCWSARRTCCAGSSCGLSGSSQAMSSWPAFSCVDGVVTGVYARRLRRRATTSSGLVLQLRRGRQPAHALGLGVVVDQRQ